VTIRCGSASSATEPEPAGFHSSDVPGRGVASLSDADAVRIVWCWVGRGRSCPAREPGCASNRRRQSVDGEQQRQCTATGVTDSPGSIGKWQATKRSAP
jgi:hypothetical protein